MRCFLKTLKCNLTKGVVTTALGLVLFLATIGSVFLAPAVSWTDASTALVISLVLMLMPDRVVSTLRKFLEKKAGILLVPVLLLTASCASNRLPGCKQLYGEHRVDSVQVITYAKSPADSTHVLLHVDSLLHLLNRPWLEPRPPVLQVSSGKASATVTRVPGSHEHLRFNCHCKETVIRDTATVYVERIVYRPAAEESKVCPTVSDIPWGDNAREHPIRWLLLPFLSVLIPSLLLWRKSRPDRKPPYRMPTLYPFV